MPVQGITIGTQPIISYNFGAKNFDRVKKTFKYCLVITTVFTLIGGAAVMMFPTAFGSLFTDDAEMLNLIAKVMPIFMLGMSIFGIQMSCQSAFMGMGQAKISLFLAFLRKIILLVPLALFLPTKFGVMGIYYAEPISDVIAVLTTGIIFLFTFKKILKKADMA